MKNIFIPLLLFIFSTNFMVSQTRWNDRSSAHFKVGFGLNTVYDSGQQSEGIFDIRSNWNFAGVPIYVNLDYYITNRIIIGSKFSMNRYVEEKTIDWNPVSIGSAATYYGIDFTLKYSFIELLITERFEPYAGLGFGFTNIGAYEIDGPPGEIPAKASQSLNANFGLNYWFEDSRWALSVDALAKFSITDGTSNRILGSFGVVYTIIE